MGILAAPSSSAASSPEPAKKSCGCRVGVHGSGTGASVLAVAALGGIVQRRRTRRGASI
jgi:MYXO-CTERM domain-containing protein